MIRNEIVKTYIKNLPFYNKQVMLYVASGVLALVADYMTFLLLYYVLTLPLTASVPAGLIVGLIVSFLLNKQWTFSATKKVTKRQTAQQVSLYLLLFAANNLFTIYAIDWCEGLGVSAAIAKIGTAAAITMWNFVIYKKIIFRQRDDVSSSIT